MKKRIYDVTLVTPSQLLPHSAIDVENGKIIAVHHPLQEKESGLEIIDGAGCYATPDLLTSMSTVAAASTLCMPHRSSFGRAVPPMPVTVLLPSFPPRRLPLYPSWYR